MEPGKGRRGVGVTGSLPPNAAPGLRATSESSASPAAAMQPALGWGARRRANANAKGVAREAGWQGGVGGGSWESPELEMGPDTRVHALPPGGGPTRSVSGDCCGDPSRESPMQRGEL